MRRVIPEPSTDDSSLQRELAALHAAARTIGSSVDLDVVSKQCLEAIMTLLDARSGAIFVAHESGNALTQRASINMPADMLPSTMPMLEATTWLRTFGSGMFDLEGNEPRPRLQVAWTLGVRRIIFVPLGDADELIGFIAIAVRDQKPVSSTMIETLTALSLLHKAAVESARAHERSRLAAEQLAAQVQRFEQTLEHLPIALHILKRQGDMIYLNQAALDFQHQFLGEDPQRTWTERAMQIGYFRLDGTPIPMAEMRIARGFAGEVLPGEEIRMVSPDGKREMYAIVSAIPIRRGPDGTVEEVVGVILDVTEQRALAEAKDRFLRIASHELRSPLTSLRATTGLLELDPTAIADEQRRANLLGRINRQVERMTHLIDQLVDSARLQSKELPLNREAADLGELCRESLQYLIPDAQGRDIRLTLKGDLHGHFDRLRIEQIVTNLVNNAVRHSERDRAIEIEVRGDETTATLTVADRGNGMPPEQLDRLFTAFFRAKNAPPRGGLGLGLYISSEIVRRHGGKIGATLRPEGGMVFTVTLPKQPAEQR